MESEIAEILFSEKQIQERVTQLGGQISKDFGNQPILVVGVLTGAIVFVADLIRQISLPLRLDFCRASSYDTSTTSKGVVTIDPIRTNDISSYYILIVEDIVDTGYTVNAILKYFLEIPNQGVKICTFLDKPSRRKIEVPLDYIGFNIPDYFVVGYGLDFNYQYRHLPFVARLHPQITADFGIQSRG